MSRLNLWRGICVKNRCGLHHRCVVVHHRCVVVQHLCAVVHHRCGGASSLCGGPSCGGPSLAMCMVVHQAVVHCCCDEASCHIVVHCHHLPS